MLKGDLIVAGVVGEIEKAQIGRFHGKDLPWCRRRRALSDGPRRDGRYVHYRRAYRTATSDRQLRSAVGVCQRDGKATQFVLAACKVAQAIQDWEKEYQRKYPHKFMLPTVQIGAIDGGNAFKPGTRPTTDIFVIVKMLPGAVPLAIKRDIETSL